MTLLSYQNVLGREALESYILRILLYVCRGLTLKIARYFDQKVASGSLASIDIA